MVWDRAPEVLQRIEPRYPPAARAQELGDQVCRVRVDLDARGRPEAVQVAGCPEVFVGATEEALFRWRWAAARRGRERVPSTAWVRVTYKAP